MAWAAYQLTESLPYWPINPSIATTPWFTLQLDLVRCFWVVLPGAMLWGASFPLALAAVATSEQDAARLAGGVYAANTVGAIVGSLATSFVLVPWIGSSHTEQLYIIVSALSALVMLEPALHGREGPLDARRRAIDLAVGDGVRRPAGAQRPRAAGPSGGVRPVCGDATSARRTSSTSARASTRRWRSPSCPTACATITTPARSRRRASRRTCGCSGCSVTSRRSSRRRRSKVLVIGCGAGVTAGAVSIDPVVTHETIAEIEPLVPKVVSTYFADHNFDVVRNPKVHVRIDDARHFVETTHEKFDAITSDPLDPWVKGAAMLYTAEFFELAKAHLNPGGVVTLFVQLYESNTEAVKSEIGTFFEVFPNGVVWGNTSEGKGYDLVLLGQVEPLRDRRRCASRPGCSVPSTRRWRSRCARSG